ncbi:hypothetical protein K1719_025483 [Acacia pycnantha]|nr:hypothetical protein K1719_025483 [Acacia pycnantha]
MILFFSDEGLTRSEHVQKGFWVTSYATVLYHRDHEFDATHDKLAFALYYAGENVEFSKAPEDLAEEEDSDEGDEY